MATPNNTLSSNHEEYTAQITRNTPTAFVFLIDHSVSMDRKTTLDGEEMTLADAAARILNRQINELILRCVKEEEVRHYFDIAVIGYGHDVYSAWKGSLAGRDFVSPQELLDHPPLPQGKVACILDNCVDTGLSAKSACHAISGKTMLLSFSISDTLPQKVGQMKEQTLPEQKYPNHDFLRR